MRRLINYFMNFKLRTKLFLSYLFIIIMVISINYVIYKIYEADTIKNIESSYNNIVEQLSNNISNKMASLDTNLLYATVASKIFEESDS